jgi:hypothetical protein
MPAAVVVASLRVVVLSGLSDAAIWPAARSSRWCSLPRSRGGASVDASSWPWLVWSDTGRPCQCSSEVSRSPAFPRQHPSRVVRMRLVRQSHGVPNAGGGGSGSRRQLRAGAASRDRSASRARRNAISRPLDPPAPHPGYRGGQCRRGPASACTRAEEARRCRVVQLATIHKSCVSS